jgi:hypothetical protein
MDKYGQACDKQRNQQREHASWPRRELRDNETHEHDEHYDRGNNRPPWMSVKLFY